ncbi:MAG: helix-turn-helix domain-containing protein [Alphaproteobacteria bacterium]|nr:helix-turn-helix domain-containing protein [Alphaproteobacteria bacterium]
MASNEQDQQPPPSGQPGSPVGALLRASRVRVGGDLQDIANSLCIRHPYLLAIEEGRFQELPGATYATGFVRAYAEHLGLDGEEVVRRFRAETEGLRNRSRLAFPIPVSEERIPSGVLVFAGILLFAVAYGVWYWQSTSDRDVAGLVPDIPSRLMELINPPAKAPPPAAPVVADGAAPDAQPGHEAPPVTGTPVVVSQAQPAPEQVMPPASESESEDPEVPAPPVTSVAATAPASPVQSPPVQIPPAPAAPVPAVPTATPPAPVVAPPAAPAAAAPAVVPPVAAPVVAAAPVAAVKGQEGGSRVVLRFTGNVWVQIRDEKTTLVTRLMRKGDTYRVPSRPGLSLVAGNAGEVEVLVDGVPAPPLGPKGLVRRDVSLDPDSLKKGSDGAAPAGEKTKEPAAAGN